MNYVWMQFYMDQFFTKEIIETSFSPFKFRSFDHTTSKLKKDRTNKLYISDRFDAQTELLVFMIFCIFVFKKRKYKCFKISLIVFKRSHVFLTHQSFWKFRILPIVLNMWCITHTTKYKFKWINICVHINIATFLISYWNIVWEIII